MVRELGIEWLCSSTRIFIKFPSINYATLVTLSLVKYCVDKYRSLPIVIALDDAVLQKFQGNEVLDELLRSGVEITSLRELTFSRLGKDSKLCVIASELKDNFDNVWIASFVKCRVKPVNATRCVAKNLDRMSIVVCRDGIACFDVRGSRAEHRVCPKEMEALEIITRYEAEFGTLTVRDAVNAISLELGVSRDDARRILGMLKFLGLVDVRRGYVHAELW